MIYYGYLKMVTKKEKTEMKEWKELIKVLAIPLGMLSGVKLLQKFANRDVKED